MRKFSFSLALIVCLFLRACGADVQQAPPAALDVQITAGKIETGMTVRDVLVEVTIDGQPVACDVEFTRFTETGYYVMAEDEPVPEDFFGRLDVYYSLPKGADLDSVNVTMECDGGEYDGTGSVSNDAEGCVVAWSHAIYGSEPEQMHTHSWVEDTSKCGPVGCTFDGYKTYVCDCGETWREIIPATGHDLTAASSTEPTCTGVGYQVFTCKHCGEGFINELPAAGHSWSGWNYENGRVHKRVCSVCNAEEEANHTVPSGTVKCTGCGQDIVN